MYIIFMYATCVLLVAIASAAMFGLCVVVVIVQEALRSVGKRLSRVIPLEKTGTERRPVVFGARSTLHSGCLYAPAAKP